MTSSASNLAHVKHIILVLSGKGGVGKSTVSVNLAQELVKAGQRVGILDVDLTGPSVPRLTNCQDKPVHKSTQGWVPVYVGDSQQLSIMSIGFLLKNRDDPVVWRGPKKNAVIKQFLQDVVWGHLDFLIIDTPPGTSDEHITTVETLLELTASTHGGGTERQGAVPRVAAVIVTTPQMISISDVRKEITFCRKTQLPILGLFENIQDGGRLLAEEEKINFLGAIPIDTQIGDMGCTDDSPPMDVDQPQPPAASSTESLRPLTELAAHLVANKISI